VNSPLLIPLKNIYITAVKINIQNIDKHDKFECTIKDTLLCKERMLEQDARRMGIFS